MFVRIGDDPVSAPTIKELAVFPTLGNAWKDLGTALSIDDETLQSINKKSLNLVKKQRELFRAYLRSTRNPAWSDIINALVKIKKVDIARKVIDTFSLSSELLATALTQTSGKSNSARVEPDRGDLVPTSRTDVHPSYLSKLSKPRIQSDSGTLSAEVLTADTATVTPVSKRVSKTEVISLKKLGRSLFDPSKPQPKQPRLVSDDGGRASPVEETDSYLPMVERDSASLPPEGEGELLSVQMHFSSDPMGDSNSSISGGFSFRQEVRRSSEDNSPSSSDFHSAEETPLEEPGTYGEKIPKTYKGNQDSSKTHAHVSYAQCIYGIRDYL